MSNSTELPDMMKLPAVLAHTHMSRSTLYLRMEEGTFPKPIKLGPRINAWRVADIQSWIEARAAES